MDIFDYEFESLGFDFLDDPNYLLQPTTEGYVVKSKYISDMEKQIARLCSRVKGRTEMGVSTMAGELSTSIEVKELELLIQKEFGFGFVDVGINGSAAINSMTVANSAVGAKLAGSIPQLPVEHDGRYYDKNHSRYAIIGMNVGTFLKLEPDEAMAILLHEIGHAFDVTLTTFLIDLVTWILAMSNGLSGVNRKFAETGFAVLGIKLGQWLDYLVIPAVLSNLLFIGNKVLSKVLGPLGGLTVLGSIVSQATQNLSPASVLPFLNFAGERFADSFVTAYGYGDAMIRALDKMDREGYSTGTGKFFEVWSWSGGALIVPLLILLDPHPETQTRCKIILEDCEKAMHDPRMPKKMLPIAKQRYKVAKDAYDKFLSMPKEEQANAGAKFARATKERLFDGKMDFRAYIFTLSAALTKQ